MIEFQHVSLSYGEGQILKDVNFKVNRGETILLTGLSGSGKSTILKLINGLIPHYESAKVEGNIWIDGKNPKDLELYQVSKRVSTVFQNPKTHFFNTETTLELVFYLENIGTPRNVMKERLEETVELFQIHHLMNRSIFELSGGEKQILSIAQTYMSGNEIIVLDEPTANLDEVYTEKVGQMLEILKDLGKTIVIAEHRFTFLKELVDRVLLIKDGKAEEMTGEDFFSWSNETLHSLGLRGLHQETLNMGKTFDGKDFVIQRYEKEFPDHKIEVEGLGFNKGEIIGITGRNGIGKSTLVKSLMGQVKAKDEIYFLGKKQKRKERMRHAYLVMQDVTAELFTESVLSECKLCGNHDNILEILEMLNLEELKDRHPISLSGGQKQRLVIATSLLSDRPILFFDEPTSGMDHLHMKKIAELIERIKEDRIIFVISHDTEFLQRICDRILDLEEYEVIQ
ncbi:MAG: ABC transporter ATP-binding protein [Tissierellia bacterium]|nr:ABC transporter ATP-binding protein [Tissierellia bacterium]